MTFKTVPRINADILIIGGGSAGTIAAIRAQELNPDHKIVIFEKGDFQYSGSIPRGMDALNIVTIPGIASPEDFVAVNRLYSDEICDDQKSYMLAKRSYPLMKKLVDWGVFFPKKDGNYEITTLHPHKKFTVTMNEPNIKQIMVKKALDGGCRVENRTMAIALLKEGPSVAGAIGLNIRTGEIIICSAKAVILSAGGTARFGLPATGELYGTYDFPGNTGDGYLLGYRAGAKLTSMEHTMCYCIIKDAETPGTAMFIEKGAKLLNALGDTVLDKKFDLSEVNKLQNSPHGPLRVRFKHLPGETIEEIEELIFSVERPSTERFLKGRGVDLREKDMELATTELFLCGGHGMAGLVVDEKADTGVPGLYCAGDTAPLPRGYLTGAFVFGELAAEEAGKFAETRGTVKVDEKQVKTIIEQLESYKEQEYAPVTIHDFEYKVRRHINDYLTPPKNEYKLNFLLEYLTKLRNDLKSIVRIRTQRDLNIAIEVENIIDSAYLSTIASLERTESRWGFWHQRGDFPNIDNENWLKHIDLKFNPNSELPEISYRPVRRIHEIGDIQ